MNNLRILLIDDHELVRAGFRVLIDKMSWAEVVGEAQSAEAAMVAIKEKAPDLVLMDISMPGRSGLEAAGDIAREFPAVRVVLLSMHTEEEYVERALASGVAGYVSKAASEIELELALKTVARGDTYLSPVISRHVVAGYLQRRETPEAPAALTPRQLQVLRLIADGLSTKQIAQHLEISVKTAERHRAELMERLQIFTVAGLVRYAMQMGLVTPVNR